MNRQLMIFWSIVLVMAALLAGVIHYKSIYYGRDSAIRMAPVAIDCDLHTSACTGRMADVGAVTLSITPRPVPVIQVLQIEVQTQNMDSESVMVDFKGVDMDMGFNQFPLGKGSDGRFAGTGMLPICTSSRMTWQADVIVTTAEGKYIFPFRFDTFARQ